MFRRLAQWALVHVKGVVLALSVTMSALLLMRGPEADIGPARRAIQAVISAGQAVFRYPTNLAALQRENRYLRSRLVTKVVHESEIRELRQQNERLRDMLDFRRDSQLMLLAARVRARDASVPPTSVTVDVGTRHGVEPYQAVVSPEGLVGRMSGSPGASGSVVRLLTDAGLHVSVVVENRTRPKGILQWDGAALQMMNVALEASVAEGEPIATSGMGGIFPAGMYVGTVATVEDDPHALFKSIVVRPGARLDRLEEVFVVRLDTTGTRGGADALGR